MLPTPERNRIRSRNYFSFSANRYLDHGRDLEKFPSLFFDRLAVVYPHPAASYRFRSGRGASPGRPIHLYSLHRRFHRAIVAAGRNDGAIEGGWWSANTTARGLRSGYFRGIIYFAAFRMHFAESHANQDMAQYKDTI